MLILPNPLSLPALVFSLYLSLYFSSCSPGTGTVRHYWSNTVVLGKGGGKNALCANPFQRLRAENLSASRSCSDSGMLTGTTQVNSWMRKLLLSAQQWKLPDSDKNECETQPKHVCACWREPETLHKCHHPLQFDIQASEAKNSTLRSFCASCDSSDSHQELSICFGLISAPS